MADLSKVTDPQGRVDVLLYRLLEQGARFVEQKCGLKLWDGDEGLGGVVEQKIQEMGIPSSPLAMGGECVAPGVTVRGIAEQVGFVKKRRAKAVK